MTRAELEVYVACRVAFLDAPAVRLRVHEVGRVREVCVEASGGGVQVARWVPYWRVVEPMRLLLFSEQLRAAFFERWSAARMSGVA